MYFHNQNELLDEQIQQPQSSIPFFKFPSPNIEEGTDKDPAQDLKGPLKRKMSGSFISDGKILKKTFKEKRTFFFQF